MLFIDFYLIATELHTSCTAQQIQQYKNPTNHIKGLQYTGSVFLSCDDCQNLKLFQMSCLELGKI